MILFFLLNMKMKTASYRSIVHNPQFVWSFVGIQIAVSAAESPAGYFLRGTIEIVIVSLDHTPTISRVLWVDFIETEWGIEGSFISILPGWMKNHDLLLVFGNFLFVLLKECFACLVLRCGLLPANIFTTSLSLTVMIFHLSKLVSLTSLAEISLVQPVASKLSLFDVIKSRSWNASQC